MNLMKKIIPYSFLLLLVIATLFFFRAHSFLSLHRPANSHILLVEGWIPSKALEQVADLYKKGTYEKVIVTGIDFKKTQNIAKDTQCFPCKNNRFNIYKNGVFQLVTDSLSLPGDTIKVQITAYGRSADGYYPHFTLFMNESIAGNSFVNEQSQVYLFNILNDKKPVRKVSIRYNNDAYTLLEDRNLYIGSVQIADKRFDCTNGTFVFYPYGETDKPNSLITFNSPVEAGAYYLNILGIPDSVLISVPGIYAGRNKTKYSAIAFDKWAQVHMKDLESIDICTSGIHARRTYHTYKQILNKDIHLGIYRMEDKTISEKNWWKSTHGRTSVINEFFSYIAVLLHVD